MTLEDAQRTVGLVRFHAAEYDIDPHKIGVLGFSAGGHLATDVSTHFDKRLYSAVDAADKESCRPDFAVAVYPGHMMEGTSQQFELNPTIPVSSNTPPTFLLQAEDDPVGRKELPRLLYCVAEGQGSRGTAFVCEWRACVWPAAQQVSHHAMAAAAGVVAANHRDDFAIDPA